MGIQSSILSPTKLPKIGQWSFFPYNLLSQIIQIMQKIQIIQQIQIIWMIKFLQMIPANIGSNAGSNAQQNNSYSYIFKGNLTVMRWISKFTTWKFSSLIFKDP